MEIPGTCLESLVQKVAQPLTRAEVVESMRISRLPLGSFFKGLVPMVILVFQRLMIVTCFVILPFEQAVSVLLLLVLFNYTVAEVPQGESGLFQARPMTESQYKLASALSHFTRYEPPVWCLDNHWSTILPLLLYNHAPKQVYRQNLTARDGATLGLDWYITPVPIEGVILAIPGLNGSSQGTYCTDLMERMGPKGYAIAVLNGRGAGRSKIHAVKYAFHLGRSSDLLVSLEAIEALIRPNRLPIFLLGYSAGGVRAMKFASVYGQELKGRVAGILSFGASLRNHCTLALKTSTHVYQPVIAHTYAATMLHKISESQPQSEELIKITDLFTARSFESFRDFDRRVTSVIHNMTLEEYEREVFAYHDERWLDISVPCLVVNAIDDPVLHVQDAVIPEMASLNSNICFLVTKKGGHIGWPTGLSMREHGYRWISDVAYAFIKSQ